MRRRLRPDRATALRAIPLFSGCTDAQLRRLDALVDDIDMEPGEIVASEREVSRDSYVIASGEATVVLRERSIGRLGPGDVFGELGSLLPGRPASATVTAITPLRVLVVEERNLAALVAIPPIGQQLAVAAVARLTSGQRLPCR